MNALALLPLTPDAIANSKLAGVLKFARDLLIMAVPFMIGALASVAMGSPGTHMDRRPVGAELVLDGEVLSLRQFVCYLLGYLSFPELGCVVAFCRRDYRPRPSHIHTAGVDRAGACRRRYCSCLLAQLADCDCALVALFFDRHRKSEGRALIATPACAELLAGAPAASQRVAPLRSPWCACIDPANPGPSIDRCASGRRCPARRSGACRFRGGRPRLVKLHSRFQG